ncbi:MAG: 2-C-methyl-D-erythritol 4-phosphate cytidylyltransferase [Eubacterium sp.]
MEKKVQNVALIIAGGVGSRMKAKIPKQFMRVNNKEVIFYTLEAFQKNRGIDAIVVVCLHGWEDTLKRGAEEYGITKMLEQPNNGIVPGGDSGMHSLRNGMLYLKENYDEDSIIVIHDAVRPLISQDIINANIAGVKRHGTAITTVPATEALLQTTPEDPDNSSVVVDRSQIARTQTPQSLRLSKFIWAHEQAVEKGIVDTVATCTLLVELGESVHLILGEGTNFKITTQEDIDLMKAYLAMGYKG